MSNNVKKILEKRKKSQAKEEDETRRMVPLSLIEHLKSKLDKRKPRATDKRSPRRPRILMRSILSGGSIDQGLGASPEHSMISPSLNTVPLISHAQHRRDNSNISESSHFSSFFASSPNQKNSEKPNPTSKRLKKPLRSSREEPSLGLKNTSKGFFLDPKGTQCAQLPFEIREEPLHQIPAPNSAVNNVSLAEVSPKSLYKNSIDSLDQLPKRQKNSIERHFSLGEKDSKQLNATQETVIVKIEEEHFETQNKSSLASATSEKNQKKPFSSGSLVPKKQMALKLKELRGKDQTKDKMQMTFFDLVEKRSDALNLNENSILHGLPRLHDPISDGEYIANLKIIEENIRSSEHFPLNKLSTNCHKINLYFEFLGLFSRSTLPMTSLSC